MNKSSSVRDPKPRSNFETAALVVEWWPIENVKPYANNARKLSTRAVSVVQTSLKQFGWRQPIVVDRKGVIVVGHTRLLAAQANGEKQVPVHVAGDLSAAQAKAYRLMDNRSRGRVSLRRLQFEAAQAGNPAILIWLGKQWLHQQQTVGVPEGGPAKSLFPEWMERLLKGEADNDKPEASDQNPDDRAAGNGEVQRSIVDSTSHQPTKEGNE